MRSVLDNNRRFSCYIIIIIIIIIRDFRLPRRRRHCIDTSTRATENEQRECGIVYEEPSENCVLLSTQWVLTNSLNALRPRPSRPGVVLTFSRDETFVPRRTPRSAAGPERADERENSGPPGYICIYLHNGVKKQSKFLSHRLLYG